VYYYQVRVFENNALQITSPPVAVAPWQAGGPGTFIPLPPSRLLDTRTTNGGHNGAIGTRTAIHLQVAGRGGVPSTGVGSVELNVTGTIPSALTYLSVFPTGQARPNTSILNLVKGQTRADAVTVLLGTSGQVDIYNAAGAVNVVVDVVGFYANTVSQVTSSPPFRSSASAPRTPRTSRRSRSTSPQSVGTPPGTSPPMTARATSRRPHRR
jgi:hypothetical protein